MLRPVLVVALVLAMAAPAAGSSIVGGQETTRDWPFMVYIEQGRQEIDREDQRCGGSLVAPTWVLTAAHCITGPPDIQWAFTNIVIYRRAKSDSGSGERIQAKRIVVNPDYEAGEEDTALIELERAPQNPRPIKVGGVGEEAAWAPGAMATVLGWGATSSGGPDSDVLREAQLPIMADEGCGASYADPMWGWTPQVMVCAGYPQGGTDSCQGDSGGPLLVFLRDGTPRLVGATSFGEGCGQAGRPGVYAELTGDPIRSWVAGVVPDAIAPPAPPVTAPAVPAPGAKPAPAERRKAGRAARRAACRRKARRLKGAKRKRALRRCARLR